MKLYTITATPVREGYTAYKNANLVRDYPASVAETLRDEFSIDGFTIYKTQGYWKGNAEDSFKIELALDTAVSDITGKHLYTACNLTHSVEKIAEYLRDQYAQDAVMLTYPDGSVKFI